jgi:hypothetical protein
MTVQLTAAGMEARSIMRWAWQDPEHRAEAALETVQEMAAGADGAAANEIGDATVMLSRLVGTLDKTPPVTTVGAQLSGPQTIGDQLDLAAIHGHHVPGTAFTMRHGWIPLIGPQLNDTSEAIRAHREKMRAAPVVNARAAALQRGESPELVARRFATVPSAQGRELSAKQQALVRRHAELIARAQRARERAASPATPRGIGGMPVPGEAAARVTAPHYQVPAPAKAPLAAAAPRTAPPSATPDTAREAADVFAALPPDTSVPTPAHAAAVAAGQALKTEPGTTGAHLQETDPALASLVAPGASQAALKSYVDARIAAEVARQVGQITQQQHDEVEKQLDQLHRSQQRTISFLRKQATGIEDENARKDRIHLMAYSLFTIAGVGLAIAGIMTGIAPIAAAMVAALAPLAQIINDYVRSA